MTEAITTNTTANAEWGTGENGFYDFDAGGAPAVGAARLAYSAGQDKLAQVVTDTMIPNPGGVIIDPETGLRTNDVNQRTYSTRIVQEVTGSTYNGERTLTDQVANGFRANTETVADNWTRYNSRVDFGSNFTIDEFANGANDANIDATGTINKTGRDQFSIPTPSEAVMALPTYATVGGNVASNAVKGNDDTTVASRNSNMSVTVTGGGALKLDTGQFNFSQGFGTFHGPAAVSDVFAADQGDFLKLDYTAQGVGDDYHVAGYIYEVKADGSPNSAPIIALNETGSRANSRASVEVPTTGNYRFVFVVGTHDLTGGRLAGADMTIDNIVAEEPYIMSSGAIGDLLKAVHFQNDANAANPNKTLVAKVSNSDGTAVLTDDALINMQNFALTSEPDGPYMLAPTLNFTTQPSEGGTGSAVVLTKKIETVQNRLNLARTQAGSQYGALEEAINITTDLRSQFALGSGALSDLNFSVETVNLTRRQMQQDVATTVLAQANKSQSSLVSLVDGSYRSYLNS
jgi:flagellin-like hook-associated protein FlgL